MRPCTGRYTPWYKDMRHFMRAGRPYCMSQGGNVGAGRTDKTPKVKGGTPSALRATTPFKTPVLALLFFLLVPHKANKKETRL